MIVVGFSDVRIVAGPGDRGADVLGVKDGQLWVFQCKHTTTSSPTAKAVDEVVSAGKWYSANRLVVATSRPPGGALLEARESYARSGLNVELAGPDVLMRLAEAAPEYSPLRRELRAYQVDSVNKFRSALTRAGRAQIVLATGLGKTVVMADAVSGMLRDNEVPDGRVLVMAHTVEIVKQIHQAFWYQLQKTIPTHQLTEGEFPTFWEGVTFATVQSVAARESDMPSFGLVLVDEAHHVGMPTFQSVIEKLSPKMLGGVTATPWRGDEFDLDQFLGAPVVQIGIPEGLRNGFLSEVDYRLLADNIDWDFVQEQSRHRYSLSQLNRRLIIPTRDELATEIVSDTFKSESRKRAILFSPSIIHSEAFSGLMRKRGMRVESISSGLPPRERDLVMSRFRAGELDAVSTVDIFNEGVDVPDVDMVVFLRVTHSRRIFVQQLGRGLRVSPAKDKVVVLDFVTDLRRMAEVLELDAATRGGEVERLGLGSKVIQFRDESAGGLLKEWVLDQASVLLREGDPSLEMPRFEFPRPPTVGTVE